MSMPGRLLATTLAISASACSSDPVRPSPPSAVHSDASADASADAFVAEAPGSPGDVYLAVAKQGILRIDGDQAILVYPTTEQIVDLALSPSGALFASFYELGTIRIRGANAETISRTPYHKLGIRSDTDVWATPDAFGWAVHRRGPFRRPRSPARQGFSFAMGDSRGGPDLQVERTARQRARDHLRRAFALHGRRLEGLDDDRQRRLVRAARRAPRRPFNQSGGPRGHPRL